MRLRVSLTLSVLAAASLFGGVQLRAYAQTGSQQAALATQSSTPGPYVLVAWSELGMHCMDGKDYSIFSVLPPYNTIHAQLYKRGEPPTAITAGVTVTYQAVADVNGSLNSFSASKTNFWKYSKVLFQGNAKAEMGLAGYPTQSTKPAPMSYNKTLGFWEAVGIPTIPYDDAGKRNPFPMAMLVAKDTKGNILASVNIVVPVSDEMSCADCHASGSSAAAKPQAGWVKNADPVKDMKLNILRKHDDRWPISRYLSALKSAGWTYESSLYKTVIDGTPVLCAACHGDNALSLPGLKGIAPLSQDMHALHGSTAEPATGVTLDKAVTDAATCYNCHPGPVTQCKRGAMNKDRCVDCHGTVTHVGDSSRNAWLVEPACQMCHQKGLRLSTTFGANGKWVTPTDATFATNANVPVAGSNLFRFSTGHGKVYCAACHNSPHAEFPSLQANDNVYSFQLQSHAGKITECVVCHTNLPASASGGPHGMHTIGQSWVNSHGDYADKSTVSCGYCHGSALLGTYLSKTGMARTFSKENGTVSFAAGHQVSCNDCHSAPNGSSHHKAM